MPRHGGCTPRMTGCAVQCGHFQKVMTYREERQRQEMLAEEASLGYATEYKEYVRDNPLLTFRDFLIQTKRGVQ